MYAQEHNKVNVTSAANLSNRFTPPAYQIFLCLVKLLLKRKANASHPSQEKAPQMVVNGTSFSISRWLFTIYDLISVNKSLFSVDELLLNALTVLKN